MGRPATAAVTTAERLAESSARTAAITVKEPGKAALAARTAIAAAPTAAAAAAGALAAKKLTEGSAMEKIEAREAERRKRKQQPQP